MNYDLIEYIWDGEGVKLEVIITESKELGEAMDKANERLGFCGIKLPQRCGRVEWNELIVCGEQR